MPHALEMKGCFKSSSAVALFAGFFDSAHTRKSLNVLDHLSGSRSVGGGCVAMMNRACYDIIVFTNTQKTYSEGW